MKFAKFLLVVALLCLLSPPLKSQTQNEQNLKKYWENRDRLRKYFLRIGSPQGYSIPAAWRIHDHPWSEQQMDMIWSDATSYLGWYIAVLATEYNLLQNDNLSTTGTLNELYYAINAVKRLDKTGEVQYALKLKGDHVEENENGWFIRDDIGKLFFQNWEYDWAETSASDYWNSKHDPLHDFFGDGNDPSMDQAVMLMMGFYLIKKYVPNVFVKPTPSDVGFNIVDESVAITHRVMTRLLDFKRNAQNDYFDDDQGIFYKKNWSFGNPVYNWKASGKHDDYLFFYAYPLAKMGNAITGQNYDFGYKIQIGGDDFNAIFTIPFEALEYIFWHSLYPNNAKVCINVLDYLEYQAGNLDPSIVVPQNITRSFIVNVISNLTNKTEQELIDVFTYCPFNYLDRHGWEHAQQARDNAAEVNLLMALEAGAIGGTLDISQLKDKSDLYNVPIFPFLAQVIRGASISSTDRDAYLALLNDMPLSEGAYNYKYDDPNRTLSGHGANGWDRATRWEHPGPQDNNNPDNQEFGNFNSLDYMLMYNLFHMAFKNDLSLPKYSPEVICPGYTDKFPEQNNSLLSIPTKLVGHTEIVVPYSINTLTSTVEAKKYKFDYEDFGINLEKYIVKDVNVQGTSGVLLLKEDVKTCGNTKVYANIGGKIQVGNSATSEPSIMRFAKGTELVIQGGGILEVQDNSKVIIEEGAVLRIHQNSVVNLNGPNAVLEIRGKLDILANATFNPQGTGYVLFNIKEQPSGIAPYNISATNTSQIIFQGTGRQLKVMIAPGTIVYPPDNLQLFKLENVKVSMPGLKTGIKLGCTFHLVNTEINGDESDGVSIYKLKAAQFITNNNFVSCKHALNILAKGTSSRYDLKIQNNDFYDCENAITLPTYRAHIAGNQFSYCVNSVCAGSSYGAAPGKVGGYFGPLNVELNKFYNSFGIEVEGSAYPMVNIAGNVFEENAKNRDFGYMGDKANTTVKCNYFYKMDDAIYAATAGTLNLSTTQAAVGSPLNNMAPITGGNNFFEYNNRGITVIDPDAIDPTNLLTYSLKNGSNSFEVTPIGPNMGGARGSSLLVTRPFNLTNYTTTNSGLDYLLTDNYWNPIAINYIGTPPLNYMETNRFPSYHFNINEYFTPRYVIGPVASAPSHTCPISTWTNPIQNPHTFDPKAPVTFVYEKLAPERPFGLDGTGVSTTPTIVTGGTYMGTNLKDAFNSALGSLTTLTIVGGETVYKPSSSGLLNMANLLANTAQVVSAPDQEIFRLGYQTYLNTLAESKAYDIYNGEPLTETTQITAALSVFTALANANAPFEMSQPNRFYANKFNREVDKCHMYRTFERYTEAQSVISGLSSFAHTEDVQAVDYLDCSVENEKQLFLNEITWPQFEENTKNCGILFGTSRPTYPDSVGGWNNDTSSMVGSQAPAPPISYVISPNPATASITATIDVTNTSDVTMEVFNKFGVKVINTINLGTLTSGQYQPTIALSGLTGDVYNLVVYANGIPYVKKFIKLNE